MLYALSSTEDPTDDDVSVVEAASASAAVRQAEGWVADGDTIYVFEVKKSSRKSFRAKRGWTFTPTTTKVS